MRSNTCAGFKSHRSDRFFPASLSLPGQPVLPWSYSPGLTHVEHALTGTLRPISVFLYVLLSPVTGVLV